MIKDELESLEFIENSRFKIKSKDNEFKNFKGILTGISNDIYEWNGIRCTGDHLILINNEWKHVKDLEDSIKLNASERVYDFLEVEDHNAYMSNDYLHHNCQTGEQLISIKDKKTNEKKLVSFKQLEMMIDLDNVGIDYNDSKIIEI